MQWTHPEHPGKRARLAYCMNLHPAQDHAGLIEGMRQVTLPLRDRVAGASAFGVGPWLPAELAHLMVTEAGASALHELSSFLKAEHLDPFTFNAFPYGDFHREGLKADVYRPTWSEVERVDFTVAVAKLACCLAREDDAFQGVHLSISTHPGGYGDWIRGASDLFAHIRGLCTAVLALVRLEEQRGVRIVLSLEAEPHASASDNRQLFAHTAFARAEIGRALAADPQASPERRARAFELAQRHLGTCLDACHSAVSFEAIEDTLRHNLQGGSLGKLQFSSALSLDRPADHPAARQQLLAMQEPRYLHQVVGRQGGQRLDARDLPALAADLVAPERARAWLACDAWRCHFHVPVDLDQTAELGTTRAHADELLRRLLTAPDTWSTPELHVEIETYTWDVLPRAARGRGQLVDGLEREYRHVMALFRDAGWKRL